MARKPIDITIPNLTGKRVVLTGGSDGMGLVIATRLAAAGADLILPVRNPQKGEAAIDVIRKTAPDATVSLRSLELSSLESVSALGETLRGEGDPIHVFIGNAGIMNPPERQTTKDGFELQFGTNHLGHAALIGHILPLLREGGARVTLQLSIAANQGAVNWDERTPIPRSPTGCSDSSSIGAARTSGGASRPISPTPESRRRACWTYARRSDAPRPSPLAA
jgi:NAD(P)-dependent dehydrogenase (short-subunit alcohol dehydrogenase family)